MSLPKADAVAGPYEGEDKVEAAPAAPQLPRPTRSDDLLAARAVAGDDKARRALASIATGTLDVGSPLGDTARTYLRTGSLEGTARELFVHANTVRYRLRRITDLTGWDPLVPRDAFVLHCAVLAGRLNSQP